MRSHVRAYTRVRVRAYTRAHVFKIKEVNLGPRSKKRVGQRAKRDKPGAFGGWQRCGSLWYNYRPMQQSWTLFTIMGIPIRVNLSVLLLVVYLAYRVFMPTQPLDSLTVAVYLSVVLLGSILVHELAHSAVAMIFGGRVRDITLQLLGGCAALTRMPPKPWQECLMAVAGPLSSFLLAFAFSFLATKVFPTEEPYAKDLVTGTIFTRTVPNVWLEVAAAMNFGLGAFNLVPAFPMDGGRILRSLLQTVVRVNKVKATTWAVYVGRGFAVLWGSICVLGFMGIEVPRPAEMSGMIAFCWDILFGNGGILLLLIAYMIWVAGMRELQYVRYEAYYGVSE